MSKDKKADIFKTLKDMGFTRVSGVRAVFDGDAYTAAIYDKKDHWNVVIATPEQKIKTSYSNITPENTINMVADIHEIAKSYVNTKTEQSKIKEVVDMTFEPEKMPIDDVSPDSDYTIEFAAPNEEDIGFSPLMMDYEDIEKYAATPSDVVDTELVAKVHERDFQPMNSYPSFPFDDDNAVDIIRHDTPKAAEAVEITLLDAVRDKEGKYLVEKDEEFGSPTMDIVKKVKNVPKAMMSHKVLVASIVIGAGVLAFLWFKNKQV